MTTYQWPFTVHELKTVPPYFDAVASGAKPFEVRRDDRGFMPGDLLVLREWLPEVGDYSPAAHLFRKVTYVLRGRDTDLGIDRGVVVMGLLAVPEPPGTYPIT